MMERTLERVEVLVDVVFFGSGGWCDVLSLSMASHSALAKGFSQVCA